MRSTGSPIASECTPRRYATGSVKQRSTDPGFRSGTTTGDADRIAQQEREAAAPADSSLSTRQLPHDKILNASPDVQPHYAATEYAGLPLVCGELYRPRTRHGVRLSDDKVVGSLTANLGVVGARQWRFS